MAGQIQPSSKLSEREIETLEVELERAQRAISKDHLDWPCDAMLSQGNEMWAGYSQIVLNNPA